MDDRLEVQFLGGEARKTLLEIESHLMAKHADGTRASAVALFYAFGENAVE